MSFLKSASVAVAAVLLVVNCGSSQNRSDVRRSRVVVDSSDSAQHLVPEARMELMAERRQQAETRWAVAVLRNAQQNAAAGGVAATRGENALGVDQPSMGSSSRTAGSSPVPVAAPSGLNCGGTDYPPCYVAQRESGNTYDAYNPTGCGGNGCWGRWQFSGAWAGKLGLPLDLSQATPAQQDAAARALWNHGAGCSNWAAC